MSILASWMGSSWGHAIAPLTPDDQRTVGAWHHGECAIGKCAEPARWLGTYRYVTGRAGRVSWARRFMCDGHAEKFRKKYQPTEGEVGTSVAGRSTVVTDA